MLALCFLVLAVGVIPLAAGLFLLKPSVTGTSPASHLGSVLLCALAFNLTFFWQELGLVIPKALTPGLHPILFHNNHDWTGDAPVADLLQGTGAVATLFSGLAFSGILLVTRRASSTWRLFFFWMAFQGLFQSLTQLSIGTLLPGNDVGRALSYLHIGGPAKAVLLVLSVAAMAFTGASLARAYPGMGRAGPTRGFGYGILLVILLSILLIVPFRVPRNIIEVLLVPLIINLIGAGWLVFGAAMVRRKITGGLDEKRPSVIGPALALGATLLLFQLVLRPGIAF